VSQPFFFGHCGPEGSQNVVKRLFGCSPMRFGLMGEHPPEVALYDRGIRVGG
jgi:hypothetical protein